MTELRLKENLKWLYKNSGHKNQEQFARQFGITRGMFESYLRGSAEPTLQTAADLCREFGITINQLLYAKLSIDIIRSKDEAALSQVAEPQISMEKLDKIIEDKVASIMKKNSDVVTPGH